jgi:catechol 2,3-dioxygenase-like lactoylglutathione lyase family enzyme
MSVQLNHTIVPAREPQVAATFLCEILGLPPPTRYGPFQVVTLANGVSLDYMRSDDIRWQHYAFLVDEAEFDQIFARIRARELPYWADPGHHQPGTINHHDGGRGVYFGDPNGHNLEILTRPYGSGA